MECNFSELDSFTLLLKLRIFLEERSREGDKSTAKLLNQLTNHTYPISDQIYKLMSSDYKKDFIDNYMKN